MAEFVIMLRDNLRANHPSPNMAYRPGDVVTILNDGVAASCRKMGPPLFAIVEVPGVQKARLDGLGYAVIDADDDEDGSDGATIARRRRFRIDASRMSAALREKLLAGRISVGNRTTGGRADDVTIDDFADFLENARTGETEKQRGVTDATWRAEADADDRR